MVNPIDYFGDISLHGGALKEVAIEQVETLPVDNLVKGRIVLFNKFIQFYDGAKWVVLGDPADFTALEGRVTTVEGKVTTLETDVGKLKTKVATIEEGAEVNIIETVKVNGTALEPDSSRAVNIDLSKYALKSDLTAVLVWKGTVATFEALPTDAKKGDVYHVEAKSAEYAFDGTEWQELGSIVDLSDYYNKKAIDDKVKTINDTLATKVDKLAVSSTRAGTYTKVTINAEGQVESGEPQITIDDISNIASANVATAVSLKTAQNFSIIGGAKAGPISFNGTDAVELNVTELDGTKVKNVIPVDSVPTIPSTKIEDFDVKVKDAVRVQFKEVSLSTASASGNTYTLHTAGKAFGVMVFNGTVQVFVSTTVTADTIVLDFNSAITPANFSVTYIEKF